MTLSAHDLSVQFGTRIVLHDTGFADLRPGHLTALIGPNAAGKSPLFRTIARFIKPRRGTVMLGRQDLNMLSTQARL